MEIENLLGKVGDPRESGFLWKVWQAASRGLLGSQPPARAPTPGHSIPARGRVPSPCCAGLSLIE